MNFLQKIGRRIFGVETPQETTIDVREPVGGPTQIRRWDSNDTDRLNQGHWQKATGLPINAELAYAINNLRARTEYEFSSNPIVEGIINTYITDVVGPEGPTYRVQSSNSEYNRARERVWKRWTKHAGANRQLSMADILGNWVRALWLAGEFVTQLINDESVDTPIKMRLLPIHVHRLMTPPEMLGDSHVALGVRRDDNRNPLEYYISEPYIFGPYEVYTGKFDSIPYKDCIHGFSMIEEDQVRGVPWLASSLKTIAQLRDFDTSLLEAARQLAKTGILWKILNPDVTPTVIRGTAPMEDGQQTFGPPGYDAQQIQPTQPSGDQQTFRKEKKMEIGRGVCMPGMIINLDSSGHNYSSARFDNQPYWRGIAKIQGWLARIGLDRIEQAVMREAEIVGEIEEDPDDLEVSWGWIKPPHVDPTKESEAEREYMQNGTLAWSDAVIAHGEDPDRLIETRKRDNERLLDAGLPIIPGIPDKPAGPGAPPKEESATQPKINGSRFAGSRNQ